jgi:pilus assembly protein CpaF
VNGVGLGPLQQFFADDTTTEVMVNGPGAVWIEREGRLLETDVVVDRDCIERVIERMLGPIGRRVDRRTPFVDARLPDGSRVNVVIPPVALDGPCVTIRRFRRTGRALDELVAAPLGALLGWAVAARANIVVSGGAGTGKTTLLNALAAHIPPGQRVVTIEDAAELQLQSGHVVRLEARPSNAEGVGEISIRDLLRNALRMRPDRIVIGEVRGPESMELLQAMNTGHEGSMSTCHANGVIDALRRLETMALLGEAWLSPAAVREQLVSAVDIVVQLSRRPDGGRFVAEVAEVVACEPLAVRPLYRDGRVVELPTRALREAAASRPDATWVDR